MKRWRPELLKHAFICVLATESKRTFILQSINGRLAWRFVVPETTGRKLEDVQRNRPDGENVVPAGSGNFDGAFDMLLTLDLAEIKLLLSESPGQSAHSSS